MFLHRQVKVELLVPESGANSSISKSDVGGTVKDRLRIIKTHGRAKVNTPLERKFDANGDGVIDAKEAQAFRQAVGSGE